MKKYRQAAATIALLTVMLSAGLYSGSSGDSSAGSTRRSSRRGEAILAAFENHDYAAWQRMVGSSQENYRSFGPNDFAAFMTARQAARAGDYEQAIDIAQGLVRKLQNPA